MNLGKLISTTSWSVLALGIFASTITLCLTYFEFGGVREAKEIYCCKYNGQTVSIKRQDIRYGKDSFGLEVDGKDTYLYWSSLVLGPSIFKTDTGDTVIASPEIYCVNSKCYDINEKAYNLHDLAKKDNVEKLSGDSLLK